MKGIYGYVKMVFVRSLQTEKDALRGDSVYLSVCLSVSLFVCLPACLSVSDTVLASKPFIVFLWNLV
jgi:hypothetical protein